MNVSKTHIPFDHYHPGRSQNKSFEGRPTIRKTHKQEELHKSPSCQQQHYLLKSHVNVLQNTMTEQEKKLKNMTQKMSEKRKEIKLLNTQIVSSKKTAKVLYNLEEKIKTLEENEMDLVAHLENQRKITNDALYKLDEMQEESSNNIQDIKRSYKEHYLKIIQDQTDQYEARLKKSEAEKENLRSSIKEFQGLLSTKEETENKVVALGGEVAILKSRLHEKAVENEKLIFENKDLKKKFEEHSRFSQKEIQNLKSEVQHLHSFTQTLRTNEDEIITREAEKTIQFQKTIQHLQHQLQEKIYIIEENENVYQEQTKNLNRKLANLQAEVQVLRESETELEKAKKELQFKEEEFESTKDFYKEKLEKVKIIQREQKDEWSKAYHELLAETKQLKRDLSTLETENTRLITLRNQSLRQNLF